MPFNRISFFVKHTKKVARDTVKPAPPVSSLQVRKLISDFAIILTIFLFCGVDAFVGVDTPKLIVPSEFKVKKTCPPSGTLLSQVQFPLITQIMMHVSARKPLNSLTSEHKASFVACPALIHIT